jgi:formylglycine-generating enzyme required for sulfatase activity
MSIQQINGSGVTSNSTNNNGGSSIGVGSNTNIASINSANTITHIGTIDGQDTDPAISNGIFNNDAKTSIVKRATASLANVSNDYLISGALKPNLISSIKSIESRTTSKVSSAIRGGNYNFSNNVFASGFPAISDDYFGNDLAARTTTYYGGRFTANIGNPAPLYINYRNGNPTISNPTGVTPTPTPSPSSTSSVTPTPSSTSAVTPTPSATVGSTPTPTPSTTGIIIFKTSNTANYNNCASWDAVIGNVTTVGSNGNSGTYNTYDMNGNTYEWTERTWFGSSKGLKGGTWSSTSDKLIRTYEAYQVPTFVSNLVGFRVASTENSTYFTSESVGDINNANDSAGIGSVSYTYKISKYPITNTEYAEFLNSVAATDANSLYDSGMGLVRGGITRSGSSGSYSYSVKSNYENKPAIYINWYNAARYCNWLHNNKASGVQDNTTTEDGAYQLTGNSGFPTREFDAKYFIPNGDEWQKAAFYKGGSTNAGYWDYATQSDTAPTCISANSIGNGTL